MIKLRKSDDRGKAQFDWLDSFHTFSFGHYYDENHMQWGPLRVINEDHINPSAGFPMHPHRDMEIFSYVVEGALAHKDSEGHASQIHEGRIQLMGAGTGIRHSEFNPSSLNKTWLLQIWIQPKKIGLPPSYQEKDFDLKQRLNKWLTLVAPTGETSILDIRQDTRILNTVLEDGKTLELPSSVNKKAWLQLIRGEIEVHGKTLTAGDAIAISDEPASKIKSNSTAEILYFDLPI